MMMWENVSGELFFFFFVDIGIYMLNHMYVVVFFSINLCFWSFYTHVSGGWLDFHIHPILYKFSDKAFYFISYM